jgi:hypothetical protein
VREGVLTTTGALPTEVKVSGRVVGVLRTADPKATLAELICSVGTYAFSWSEAFIVVPPSLAVTATVCEVKTDETVAVNCALVPFIGIDAELGTMTAGLFVERVTSAPPLGADELSVTVQTSVPAPVNEEVAQEIALNATVEDACPVPLKAMTAVPLVDELLERVSCPAAAPATDGSN